MNSGDKICSSPEEAASHRATACFTHSYGRFARGTGRVEEHAKLTKGDIIDGDVIDVKLPSKAAGG